MMHSKQLNVAFVMVLLLSMVQVRAMNRTVMMPVRDTLKDAIRLGQNLSGRNIKIETNKAFEEVPGMGFGDNLQFLPVYDEYLKEQRAEVVVDPSRQLKGLLSATTKMKLSDKVDTTGYESIELADLYDALHNRVPNFERPLNEPLIKCPHEIVMKWDSLIREKAQGSLPVILFASGNTAHNANRFPTTKDLNSLTDEMPCVQFFNAQFKGDDIKNSIRPSEFDADFDKQTPFLDTLGLVTAAVLMNRGFVISPDTATFHLSAAALEGYEMAENKVLCPLPANPDQRYRLFNYMKTIGQTDTVKVNKTCWYPKSALMFQQKEEGNWSSVMQGIKNYIDNIVNDVD